MRIVLLCSAHAVTDERVTYKQAASLAKAGHEVIVFGRGGDPQAQVMGVALRPLGDKREKVEGGMAGLLNRVRILPKLTMAALASRPDVVTCHEPESAIVGLFVKACIGASVVFDVHEFWNETLSSRMPGRFRSVVRAIITILLKYVGRRCDWITTVSPPMYEFYRSIRHDAGVDIIYNSPVVESFPLCVQDVKGPVTIVHDGYLGCIRGMVQLLEALALARRDVQVRLLVVGRVNPSDQALFDKKVSALGLGDAIELPGWVTYEKVGQLLSRGQIGVVGLQPSPNNYMGLSNKLFNYMCCGQAVIVPSRSATADIVRGADCGIDVDTTCPKDIADAIVTLVKDPNLRKRFGTNGRKAIEATYSWANMEDRLAMIYREIGNRLK